MLDDFKRDVIAYEYRGHGAVGGNGWLATLSCKHTATLNDGDPMSPSESMVCYDCKAEDTFVRGELNIPD